MENRDVEVVHQLEQECFSMPWSEQSLSKEVDNPQSLFYVYEENEKILAYMGMYCIGYEGDITNVAVTTSERHKGIGRELLSKVLEEAETKGLTEFTLEVRESNKAAISLYESLGFKTEGVRKNFYDNPKENGLIMWKR